MSLWRQLRRGLRALGDGAAADRDVAEEVAHYLDEATAAHEARGLSHDDAVRAARLDLGGATSVREQVRGSGWEHTVDTALADVRSGVRALRAAPAVTAVAIFTLAIGIGGTTAIFSAVYPILLAPLPYPDADRVVSLIESHGDGARGDGTFAVYRRFVERAQSLEAVAVFKPWQPSITGSGQPERLVGQRVSSAYFRVLGMAPIAGRDFTAEDDRFSGPNVAILSDALWRRRFDADPAILGRQIRLDDNLFTVVGVMPGGFENVTAPAAALWAPLQYNPSLPTTGREWGHHLKTIARLAADASATRATAEVDDLGRALVNERRPPTYDPNTRFAALPLQQELTRAVRPALLAVAAAVALVLLVACLNVTNLLLARSLQRRAEFALRAALGAGHARLVRQLLTESALLAAAGGLAGIMVARLGVSALVALSPAGLPRVGAIRVDAAVFGFGAALTTLIGLGFGIIPALQAARSDPQHHLRHTSQRITGGHRRVRRVLVVSEVALAFMLLVGSGLLLRSLDRLLSVPLGFDSADVLTMQVQIVGHRFDENHAKYRFFAEALETVRQLPAVVSAGFTSQLPLSGDRDEYGVQFEATPTQAAASYPAFRYAISPGYLETLQIPLCAGRRLDEHDGQDAPLVALISESLARARFRDNPLGQRLRIGPAGPFTIVGVVGNVKQASLALTGSDAVYINATQSWFADNPMSLTIRGLGDTSALSTAVREAIWSIDKDQPIARLATLTELVTASAAQRRFVLLLFEAFAFAALVLAAAGIYGVVSGSVTERTREIGVRTALGASTANIVRLVLRQGMALTLLGIGLGLAGAAAGSRAIAAMLFGVSALDPITYVGVVWLLVVVSAVACSVPAWRAVRVDPTVTLRAE